MKNKDWRYAVIIITILALCCVMIAAAAPLFNSFNSGELSPFKRYRVDEETRFMGVETLENMLVKPQGAAMRRPGMEYIACPMPDDTNSVVRLIHFEYSTTDCYILGLHPGKISFYRTQ